MITILCWFVLGTVNFLKFVVAFSSLILPIAFGGYILSKHIDKIHRLDVAFICAVYMSLVVFVFSFIGGIFDEDCLAQGLWFITKTALTVAGCAFVLQSIIVITSWLVNKFRDTKKKADKKPQEISEQYIYDNLINTLRLLASDYQVKINTNTNFFPPAFELLLLFEDSCVMVTGKHRKIEISKDQEKILDTIHKKLKSLTKQDIFSTKRSLDTLTEWNEIRNLSLHALYLFGEEYCEPEDDFGVYIKARKD